MGNEAFGALVRMGAWANDHLTDGHIPRETALLIASEEIVQKLVKLNSLELNDDDFLIHDYHDYNPTAAEVLAARREISDKRTKSGKAGGIASGIARRRLASAENEATKQTAKQTTSKNEAKRSPVPVPPVFSLSLESDVSSCSRSSDACAYVNAPELGEPDNEKQQRIVDKHLTTALLVLDGLNAARLRLRPSSRVIRPSYTSLGGIAARLASGRTLEDCLHVVAVGEAECGRKSSSFDWFDAVTPWRPENFEKRAAMDPGAHAVAGVMDSASAEKGRSLF